VDVESAVRPYLGNERFDQGYHHGRGSGEIMGLESAMRDLEAVLATRHAYVKIEVLRELLAT
jgi:hypothetical protein